MACSAVLLATGGMGQLYRNTTNPEAATADGVAMAYRAGAELSDLEFVQFHPTALYMKKVPRFLLSEALRAEGACLRNIELNRFMGKYHPMGELAPRDVVARAIVHEMEVSRAKDPFVYLDLTHLSASKVQKRFPRIYATCMQHNVDITEDVIPVRPAAHSVLAECGLTSTARRMLPASMLRVRPRPRACMGRTGWPAIPCWKDWCMGRARVKRCERKSKPVARQGASPKAAYSNGPVDAGVEDLIGQIQLALENEIGIVRTRMGMQKAIKTLEDMAPQLAHPKTRRAYEASNLHLAGLLVARSALAREESRGAHYRMDYPDHDDKKFLKHSVVRGDKVIFLS